MGDTRARVCCGTACSRVTQEHAGRTDCLSEMNADLLPLEKVVTGHGGTGKWTRKKAFGFSRRIRSRPKATPMRMPYDPRKNAGKGEGRNKDNHDYFARIPGQGHARMQLRREASSCESASELLKTLTTHDAWEEIGAQIFEEMRAVCKGGVLMSRYYSPATGWMLENMRSDLAECRRTAAATCIQAWWRGTVGRAEATFVEWAATRIQARWRGAGGRHKAESLWHKATLDEVIEPNKPVVTLNELTSMEAGSMVDLLCVVGGFGFDNVRGPDSFWILGGGRDWMDRCDEVIGRVQLIGTAPWVTKLLELSNADIFDDWPLHPDKVVMVRNALLVCFDDGPTLLARAADVDTVPRHPCAATLESWVHAKQLDRESIFATCIQACWRGWLGRVDYQAVKEAKQAKAKKERRAKRAEAKREAKAVQLSCSERLETAAPPDKSAGQLVVGKTILGYSITNDEPLYGGKCSCVGLLTGVVPPCHGGSVTVFHDAPEAFYYVLWDFLERYIDITCNVREIHRAGSETSYQDISSLRQLLSLGPPYKPHGNVDLQTLLEERREPLGYTNSGQRLVHHQDLIFMVVAAVFMQCNLVILDSATAMPHHVIVRCQRPNSRRQAQRACAASL